MNALQFGGEGYPVAPRYQVNLKLQGLFRPGSDSHEPGACTRDHSYVGKVLWFGGGFDER